MTHIITPELLSRYDKPGPRYTSYPTALEFHEGISESDYRHRLSELATANDAVSMYAHIPFCKQRCHFCGCHTAVCHDSKEIETYVSQLCSEVTLLGRQVNGRLPLAALHLGGGTPTYLSDRLLGKIVETVRSVFDMPPDAEMSIEVNPAVSTKSQVAFLSRLGFNRISLGVQDLNETVLEAIGRHQTRVQTLEMVDAARACDFNSINFDLIYGLPRQTRQTFSQTLKEVCDIRPDRIAMYSFAWIPWIRENQKNIVEASLPGRTDKFTFFADAMNRFFENDYLQIGMDHFAQKNDELAKAASQGTLFRNFMGYTVSKSKHILGVGVSAIGYVGGAFFQNEKDNAPYGKMIQNDQLPVKKGLILSADDLIRANVITELMCNFRVDTDALEKRWQIDFGKYFSDELAALHAQREEARKGNELAFTESGEPLTLTPVGRLFVRNVCMVFDRYLKTKSESRPLFSRTV